jgi:membrane peptidoglycan carboxypeptidase
MIGQKLGTLKIIDAAKKFGFYSRCRRWRRRRRPLASGLYKPEQLFNPNRRPGRPGRLASAGAVLVDAAADGARGRAIANGGKMPTRSVKQVAAHGGGVIAKAAPAHWKQADDPRRPRRRSGHDGQVRQARHGHAASGSRASTVAGKTGTAETSATARSYDAWFIFFARQRTGRRRRRSRREAAERLSAARSAAPIAKQIMQAIFRRRRTATRGRMATGSLLNKEFDRRYT